MTTRIPRSDFDLEAWVRRIAERNIPGVSRTPTGVAIGGVIGTPSGVNPVSPNNHLLITSHHTSVHDEDGLGSMRVSCLLVVSAEEVAYLGDTLKTSLTVVPSIRLTSMKISTFRFSLWVNSDHALRILEALAPYLTSDLAYEPPLTPKPSK